MLIYSCWLFRMILFYFIQAFMKQLYILRSISKTVSSWTNLALYITSLLCRINMISQMDLDITYGNNLQDIKFTRTYPSSCIFHHNFLASGVTRSLMQVGEREMCRYRTSLHIEQLYNLWVTRKLLSRKSYPNRGKPRRSVLVLFA